MDKRRRLTKVVLILFLGIMIGLGVLPDEQRTDSTSWLTMLVVMVLAVYLSLAYRRWLSMWRGWITVVMALMLTLIWLRSQWLSPSAVVQHLNVSIVVLAWALFIALFISSGLMLGRSEASLIFIGLAYLTVPIVLIAIATLYGTQAQMSNAPLGDQILWGVPITWAICIGGLSLPAFLIHSLIVLSKELNAR